MCPISIKLSERIDVGRNEVVMGVTKLRIEIYVLYQHSTYSQNLHVIRVFEDQSPFRLQRKIDIKDIKQPHDIGSNDKENCLFVFRMHYSCVYKITRETDGQHKIIKLLKTDEILFPMSVSSDGQLIIFSA